MLNLFSIFNVLQSNPVSVDVQFLQQHIPPPWYRRSSFHKHSEDVLLQKKNAPHYFF